MGKLKSMCVFCGSNSGISSAHMQAAEQVGTLLARSGIRLVYGGGNVGLMGRVADAAIDAGGTVIGIIPRFMMDKEVAHTRLAELHVVGSMHERKALMEQLADAFMTLPGGIGTFEEFCEMLAWSQLGLHSKPCGLLNVEGFFDPMVAMLESAAREGFIREKHRGLLTVASDAEDLLRRLEAFEHPQVDKLLRRGET